MEPFAGQSWQLGKNSRKHSRPKDKAQLGTSGWSPTAWAWHLGTGANSGEGGGKASQRRKRPGLVSLEALEPCWETQQVQSNIKTPSRSDQILPRAPGGQSTLAASCLSTKLLLSPKPSVIMVLGYSSKIYVPARVHQPTAGRNMQPYGASTRPTRIMADTLPRPLDVRTTSHKQFKAGNQSPSALASRDNMTVTNQPTATERGYNQACAMG